MSNRASSAPRRPPDRLHSVLIGLSTLVVLLQGLRAGLSVQEGED